MKKTKNNSTQRHKITIIFGYSLFALAALSYVLTTLLPMSQALQYPMARHGNIITIIVVFAIASLLPALAAYVIGDKSTRSRKETLHHYNGVLFGFAAYWIASFLGWIGFTTLFGLSDQPFPIPLIATNVIPVILTIVVMILLAFTFARVSSKNASVLQFQPYQFTLLVSVLGTFIIPYLTNSADIVVASMGMIGIPLVVTALAYSVLLKQKISKLARLTDAMIAMSIGWITVWVAYSFVSYLQLPYQYLSIISYTIGVIAFVVYLFLRVRR
jgi:hypothetical protein